MNNFDYKRLCPFKWYVLQNFPFIEADFNAITNYQLYSKVIECLNKIIDRINLTGEQMEDVTTAMTELQDYVNNYFENLDVQEEINNKLDEMVESGELENIITINFPYLTPELYGAKGDGITDDTLAIQTAINNSNILNLPLYFRKKTYKISSVNINTEKTTIFGNNATLESIDNNQNDYLIGIIENGCIKSIIKDLNIKGNKTLDGISFIKNAWVDTNIILDNITVDGFNKGINISSEQRAIFREMKLNKIIGINNNIGLFANTMTDSYIINSTFNNNSNYGIYIENGGSIKIIDSKCYFNGNGINEVFDDTSRIPENQSGLNYKNHGNGIYLKDCTGMTLTSVEIQDNAGDGIYIENGTLMSFSNIACDCNGLIWNENYDIIKYSDVNLEPYFYGIYFKNVNFIKLNGYFNNYRYKQSGYIQKSGMYLNTSNNINISAVSRLQINDIEYNDIDFKKTNIIINGECYKFIIPLDYISLNEGYELVNNNWNSSYIYIKNNTLYFKLCIKNTNNLPNEITSIGSINSIIRPLLLYIQTAVTSLNYEDIFDGIGYFSIDKNGNVRIKSEINNSKIINIQGSYIL